MSRLFRDIILKSYKKETGIMIRKFREARELSQTELAILALGYDLYDGQAGQRKISKFENGVQEPKISEFISISKVLGVDPIVACKHILKISK